MAKDTAAAPKLPPASVDFNALHDACKAGKKPEDALSGAILHLGGAIFHQRRALAPGEILAAAPEPESALAKRPAPKA